ncbi:oligosaccharide flippase family protein [uncultured Roseobacter sp.]|uniref:oligosaccharide flippase family protein n=1 Tax=uncultured Roseobacter sp. TaxID=114847 RepID=UPI00262875D3|nr:oligosaccharide flippase family protein [uncultured Roseobacter sp.]
MSLRVAIRDRLLSRPAVLVAHAVGLVVLSRLLTPTDFGLFALAAVGYWIAVALADLGLKSLLLKETHLDPRRHGEAVGLALVSAVVVSGAFAAIAFVLPDSVAPPAMDLALWVLAASILMGPLDLLFNIPLMQSMRFGLISVVNVIGAWTRCGVSILAALYDAGPAALAAGLLAEQIVSFGLFAAARRQERIPAPRLTGWSTLIADGGRLSATQVVRYLGDLSMMSAISAFLGVATLGIYNRANQVVKLFDSVFLASLSPVVLPAFAQAVDKGHAPAAIYLKKVELLSALIWPAFATIALMADPLCRVVLGPGWPTAPVIVQLLALMGITKPLTNMSQSLFVALGELRLGARLDVQHHIIRGALASLGALISLEAVCLGLFIAQVINGARQTRAFGRSTDYAYGDMRSLLMKSALLTVFTVGPAALALYALQSTHALLELAVGGAAAMAGFVIAATLMQHTLFFEARKAFRAIPWERLRRG